MGVITIVNKSAQDIQVKVASDSSDRGKGSEKWYTLKANGGKDTWTRIENQVIYFFYTLEPGTPVETILGLPGKTVEIE